MESKEADELEKKAMAAEKEYRKLLSGFLEFRGDWPGVGGLIVKEYEDGTTDWLWDENMDMVPCDDTPIIFGVQYIQAVNTSHDDYEMERYMINVQPQDLFETIATINWVDFEKLRKEPWMEPFKPAPAQAE